MSLINSILQEAVEDIAIPPTAGSAANITGSPMTSEDFSSAAADAIAPTGAMASIPTMPQPGVEGSSITIQKTVLNKERVIAITAELKSIIATYEKKFEKEDLSVENAEIQLSNMLDSLAFYAEKIANLMGKEPETGIESEEAIAPEPEIPVEAAEVSELPATEPTGEELPPLAPPTELSSPVEEEPASQFTSPLESI